MAITRDTISNFIGGVSQQDDKLMYTNQSKQLINFLPNPIEGLQKRPPSEYITRLCDTLSLHPYVHTIIDEDEAYQVLLTGETLKVYDLAGNEKDCYISTSAKNYIQSSNPLEELYAITIADTTFILNKTKVTALTDDLYPKTYPKSALIFVKQGDYDMDYTVSIDGTSVTYTTNTNYATDASGQKANAETVKTTTIASKLVSLLQAKFTSNFTFTRVASTILVQYAGDNDDFTLVVEDGNAGNNLFGFHEEADASVDLPATAPKDFILKIVGSSESNYDDYYVKFSTSDDGDFGAGSWKECPAPNIQYQIDAATMPHILRREADGGFTLDVAPWSDRRAGDEDTIPTPSFIGNTIQEVLTHKGRIGLISVDKVIFSDTEDIYCYFKQSVRVELDTDPIDVGSNSKMTLLRHSLPFNEDIILFSEQAQFNLQGGDSFTNSTVSMDLTSEYQCSKNCKPILMGDKGYFVFENGAYSRVMELYVSDNYTTTADDITSSVPSYIPCNIYKIEGSYANSIMLALSKQEKDSIYVYNFYYSGSNKAQSAWHKWTFENAEILNIDFDKHLLYLTVQYSDGIYLEKINMTPKLKEDNIDYLFYMDRKVYYTADDLTYDEDTKTSSLTLDYLPNSETFQVVNAKGFPQTFELNENVLTIKGEPRAIIAGQLYKTFWEMPQIYLRQQNANGSIKVREGTLMLRDINLVYADTGHFLVTITPKYTTQITSTFEFTGKVLGLGTNIIGSVPIESGTFLLPVISKNDEITITIENNGYLPCCFLSLEWLGDFTYRGQ